MAEIGLQSVEKIGENDYGYSFAVGLLGGRWYGFAVGVIEPGKKMMLIMPGCDEDSLPFSAKPYTDIRAEVIKRVGAVAQSVEHGYGGIKRWFVAEGLRGKPEDYMCSVCGSVGCNPDQHSGIDYDDYL